MINLMKKLGTFTTIGAMATVLALSATGCTAEDDGAVDEAAPADTAALAREGTEIPLEDVDSKAIDADAAEKAAFASCNIYIGTLTRSGNTLTGRGSQNGCSASATSYLTMQRSRWYGWEDLKTVTITGPGENYVNYNCAGTGKHEFRVIHTATTVGGSHLFKESAHHTWDCGN